MSDEYNQQNTPIQAQSSETMSDSSGAMPKDIDYVRNNMISQRNHSKLFILLLQLIIKRNIIIKNFILKEYSNPDQFNLGQSILRQDITGDEDSNNNWKDRKFNWYVIYCN